MDISELRELAIARWAGDGSDDAYSTVLDIVDERPAEVPGLIRALVATAPDGRIPFVGTTVVEDLYDRFMNPSIPSARSNWYSQRTSLVPS